MRGALSLGEENVTCNPAMAILWENSMAQLWVAPRPGMRSFGPVVSGLYIHDIDPWLLRFGGGNIGIRWYGVAYVLGFLVAFLLMRQMARARIGPLKEAELADFITLSAFLGVMLGGRLGYMLLYDFPGFIQAPWRFFQLWEGGMASHGGIAGLVAFTWWYARQHGHDWCGVGDNLVCVAPVGIFFGRIANFINGELYGVPADPKKVPWAMLFPDEIGENPEIQQKVFSRLPDLSLPGIKLKVHEPEVREVLLECLTPRHPSQIYQALLEGLLLFLILFGLRWKFPRLPYGVLTGLFFLLYAVFRIIGETWRHADSGFVMGINKGQFYSMFMFAAAAGFLWHGYKQWRAGSAVGEQPR
jgi:phosphatidylglycerol:prolipoprotein diacylglycerol transferase